MATPPVPPRPYEAYDSRPSRNEAPPVPPVPPSLKVELQNEYESSPHFEDPLVAPRPHRLQPDLPANMARTLQEQATSSYSIGSLDYPASRTPQPTYNPTPGFAIPNIRGVSPAPPSWNPWTSASSPPPSSSMPPAFPSPYPGPSWTPNPQYPPPPRQDDVTSSLSTLSLSPQPPQQYHPQHRQRASSSVGITSPPPQQTGPPPPQQHALHHSATVSAAPAASTNSSTSGPPSLTAPLPTIAGLTTLYQSVRQPTFDPVQRVAWCRDVLSLVNRAENLQATAANPTNVASTDMAIGPVRIGDPQLQRLVDTAVPLIMELASPNPIPKPTPAHISEAIYLRATCEASGAYPQYIKRDPRTAFRDFEFAARHGYPAAWFRIGRDYENFGDIAHAKDAFERGLKAGDERCLYRMGMAHLMGQLSLPPSAETALPFLNRAATLATVDVPQPAYVYGLLLLSEFSHISIPPQLFASYIPAGSSLEAEARKHLERAAYLNFAPAQYKLGHSYEFATPPFPFDALLSVQYYSLASQQGEIEADMALSKWFLCGSEGAFEKDEGLAWTFAEKAARKGLPNAEFAMGYYAEVGVGGPKDVETATKWYTKAAEHGNEDAKDRLRALSQPLPQALSRAEHEHLTDAKLVRTRTQAKQRSDATGARPPPLPATQGARIVENVRKNSTMRLPPVSQQPAGLPAGPATSLAGPATGPAVGHSGGYTDEPRPQRTTPGPAAGPRYMSNASSPRQRPNDLPPSGPPSQSPRPFANAPRYTLSDPGSGSATGPRPPPATSQSFAPPRQGQNRPNSEDRPATTGPPPKKGPQTFAEMGIATAKVEEKECIIM